MEIAKEQEIWCDGVILQSISPLTPNGFLMAGVGYFPNKLTPFEVEFHFANERGLTHLLPEKIVFRFAEPDQAGGILWHDDPYRATEFHSKPSKPNSDWAVAVEIKPMEE